MKLAIISTENKKVGERVLPNQFSEPVRDDIIRRAALVVMANNRQPYGASPDAGKRQKAYVSKRRHSYKTTYGIGQSRTPRKTMSVRGTQFNWVGAFAPQTVGGRRAHPPKAEKIWDVSINKKERKKAIRSALAATLDNSIVSKKHRVPDNYPFILESKFEDISKTKDAFKVLGLIGIMPELDRCKQKKVRAGRGKLRGRKYKRKVGALIVVSKKCNLEKSAANIPGCRVVDVKKLNAALLAPGAVPGRLTFFTDKSLEVMEKEALFT